MNEIQLIGVNLVYDPKAFPFFVSWEGIESLARSDMEAHALALCRVKYAVEDTSASVFRVKDEQVSTMVKQVSRVDGEIDIWKRN
jgi:hypothetical protein